MFNWSVTNSPMDLLVCKTFTNHNSCCIKLLHNTCHSVSSKVLQYCIYSNIYSFLINYEPQTTARGSITMLLPQCLRNGSAVLYLGWVQWLARCGNARVRVSRGGIGRGKCFNMIIVRNNKQRKTLYWCLSINSLHNNSNVKYSKTHYRMISFTEYIK